MCWCLLDELLCQQIIDDAVRRFECEHVAGEEVYTSVTQRWKADVSVRLRARTIL